MLFKDFQQEQLFQKAKSYFKNLMNYSLTKSFSFIKTWDSLSSEFAGESVHFSSLYKHLQTRILHDSDFQFYLIYVNNLLKYEKGRKEMGLTNSVIFKILFIMLKKEEMRFDSKSIFIKDKRKKKQDFIQPKIKRIKTENNFKSIPINYIKNHTISQFPKISQNQILHNDNIQKFKNKDNSNLFINNNKIEDNLLQKNIDNRSLYLNNHTRFGINKNNSHIIMNKIGTNIQNQNSMRVMSQNINTHSTLPVFSIQRRIISGNYTGGQMQNIYRGYPNIIKKFPIGQRTSFSNKYKKKFQQRKDINKSIIANVLKKRSSPEIRKEIKSSLSNKSISISSSSISFSPDSREESRKKSKNIFIYLIYIEKSWKKRQSKKSFKKKYKKYSKTKRRNYKKRFRKRNSSISSRSSSSSVSDPPKRTIKKFQKSFAELIQSPDAPNLKRRLIESQDTFSSKSKNKNLNDNNNNNNKKSDTSRDEGEIVDKERLKKLTKKYKKKKKNKLKMKTKRIIKKRKGKDHEQNTKKIVEQEEEIEKKDIIEKAKKIRIKRRLGE